MRIEVKCPVCKAVNQLEKSNLSCRRCKENLSLMYSIKGYSFKYRIYLLQYLQQSAPKSRQLAQAAHWLDKTISSREFIVPPKPETYLMIQEEFFDQEAQLYEAWSREEEE